MAISRSEVQKIAELAKLYFDEAELEAFTAQFQRILDYVETLKEVNVDGIAPTSHLALTEGFEKHNLREDAPHVSLPAEEALRNAPDCGDDHFKVPKVI